MNSPKKTVLSLVTMCTMLTTTNVQAEEIGTRANGSPSSLPPGIESFLGLKLTSPNIGRFTLSIEGGFAKKSKNSVSLRRNHLFEYRQEDIRYNVFRTNAPAYFFGGKIEREIGKNLYVGIHVKYFESFNKSPEKKHAGAYEGVFFKKMYEVNEKNKLFFETDISVRGPLGHLTSTSTPYSSVLDQNGNLLPWQSDGVHTLEPTLAVGMKRNISDNTSLYTRLCYGYAHRADIKNRHNFYVDLGLEYKIPTMEELRNREPRTKSARPQKRSHPTIQQTCPAHKQRHWERPPSVFNRVGL